VRKADNLPPSCVDVKKSGGLNLLEPCGPVQPCNGTALPLPLPLPFGMIKETKMGLEMNGTYQRLVYAAHDVNLLCEDIYRVSQEECAILWESVPYVKLYRYNPKHLYPKLNGYGDNGHRKVGACVVSTYCSRPLRHTRPLRMSGNLIYLASYVTLNAVGAR
jgi:hypothetical protein